MSTFYIGNNKISNLPIDVSTCNGLNFSNFDILRKYSINLLDYSTDTFYPITFLNTVFETEVIVSCSWPEYATNNYNANYIHYLLSWCGYNDTPKKFTLLAEKKFDDTEVTIGAVGGGTKGGTSCIWLRGGKHYQLCTNNTYALRLEGYTTSTGETFSPGPNYDGGTNTNVEILYKAN